MALRYGLQPIVAIVADRPAHPSGGGRVQRVPSLRVQGEHLDAGLCDVGLVSRPTATSSTSLRSSDWEVGGGFRDRRLRRAVVQCAGCSTLPRAWTAAAPILDTLRIVGRRPSTEDAMPQQVGARGNDRDQHQLPECLRRNLVAQMLTDAHAEHDRQHGSRRD